MNKKVSFDQYQRYKHVAEIIELIRNNMKYSILEVGANEHRNLEHFLPEDQITYLDIEVPEHLKENPNYIEADATKMPLQDKSYDFVIALDVFEHILPNKRKEFISEINRVAKEGFIIAAPFDTEGVEEAEIRLNEYYKVLYGEGFRWLEEHRQNSLPNLEKTEAILKNKGIKYVKFQHGSLYIWEKLMRLHFLVADSPKLQEYRFAIDNLYNSFIYHLDYSPPCYRQFIVSLKDVSKLQIIENEFGNRKENILSSSVLQKLEDLESSIQILKILEDKKNEKVLEEKNMEILQQKLLIAKQNYEINAYKEAILQNKEELIQLREELKEIKIAMLQKDYEIQNLRNISESMRLTNRIKNVLSMLSKRKKNIQLIPLSGVEKNSNEWISTDNDPQFLLNNCHGIFGWVLMTWELASTVPIELTIYIDYGQGFSESSKIELGTFFSEDLKNYQAIIYLPPNFKRLRLDPGKSPTTFKLENICFKSIGRLGVFLRAIKSYYKKNGYNLSSLPALMKKFLFVLKTEGIRSVWLKSKKHAISSTANSLATIDEYKVWINKNDLTPEKINKIKDNIKKMKYKPLISIILPVFNVEERWLRKCIDSVIAQIYPNWELCIADDASSKPHIRKVLEEYIKKDNRIKVIFREENGHISEASNSALEMATGEFIALLDHDDELTPDALYENVLLLNEHPDADMIYSDEDKINENGDRHSPFFKPDWSPDTFLSQMYTCHLGVYRTKLVREIGGFRKGYEGSQDYDLVLRLTEKTDKIYHIPKILYHWRTISESTALNSSSKNYAYESGIKAIQDALDRRGEGGKVTPIKGYPGHYRVRYPVKGNPKVSIIIPTRDGFDILDDCIESIYSKSSYRNFEIIIIDNGSIDANTFRVFEKWKSKEKERFKVERLDIPFNYSKLNNHGVRIADGEILLFLNNDILVKTPTWLEEMIGYTQRESIGAVGAMLLYPDDTIQHAGVILGIRGWAGHSHKGFPENSPGYVGRLLINANYAAVTGACLMVKREDFESVGGFDESLEVACNDVDLCLKLLKRGKYNVVLPHVKLYHYESKTRGYEDTPEKQERFRKEVNRMKEKWGDLLFNDPFYNPNLTLDGEDFSLKI